MHREVITEGDTGDKDVGMGRGKGETSDFRGGGIKGQILHGEK